MEKGNGKEDEKRKKVKQEKPHKDKYLSYKIN
jgi:hypothetical protein